MTTRTLELDDDGDLRLVEHRDGEYYGMRILGPVLAAWWLVPHELCENYERLCEEYLDRFDARAEAEHSFRIAKGWT